MNFKHIALLFSLVWLSGCTYRYPSPFLLLNDFKANRLLKSEKYDEALEQYYKMIESNPDWAGAHSNIGVILSQSKKDEDAVKSLIYAQELAEKSGDLKSLFAIHYNLGVLLGSEKKYQQAIDHYQEALNLVPNSLETKTNIELLLQQQKQEQEQKQKEQKEKEQQEQEQKKDQQDKQSGSGQGEDQKDKQDPKKDQQDKKDGDQNKDQDKNDQKDQDQEKEKPKDVKNSPKYQPRPYKGDQLSEGDVKKILGELRNQEQKIRANFDKKEREKDNDKDW